MRLMVIGASGFLGAHVRHRASAAGAEVVTAGRSGLADSPRHRLVDLAEENPARVAAMIAEVAPDAVVNCAGATTGPPEALAAANITGAYTLAKAMLLTPRPPRLVHLGSAAEYGRGRARGAGDRAGDAPARRDATAPPSWPVPGWWSWPQRPGSTPWCCASSTRSARARQQTSLPGRLTAELRRAARHGTDVRLGSLDAVRDFVDVRDVADAVFAAATAATLPHLVLNIGSGRGVPVRTMVKQLLAISGCTGTVHEDTQRAGALGRHPLATGRHQLRRSRPGLDAAP